MVGHEDVAAQQKASALTNPIKDGREKVELVFREHGAGAQNVARDKENLAGDEQPPKTGHDSKCNARFAFQSCGFSRGRAWKRRDFRERKLRYQPAAWAQ